MRRLWVGALLAVALTACGEGGSSHGNASSGRRVPAASLEPRFRNRPEPIVRLAPHVWRDAKGYVFGLGADCQEWIQAHPGQPDARTVGACY